MLTKYEDAFRAAAERIADLDRRTRQDIGHVMGQEENYTYRLSTRIQDELNGFSNGGLTWKVYTYNPRKMDESFHGSDIVFAINLEAPGEFSRSKGFLVQAKVNKNSERGLSVAGRPRLEAQCREMLIRTQASYVFAYGRQITKIARAKDVVEAKSVPLSGIYTDSVSDFFYDVFVCKSGDDNIVADNAEELQELAGRMLTARAISLTAKPSRG